MICGIIGWLKMTETRAPYGPPSNYKINLAYHLVIDGQVSVRSQTQAVTAKDAIQASREALAAIERAQPVAATVTKIMINVSVVTSKELCE
jgi:hypothetical protein